jgi:hypothetical protein
MHSTFLIIRRGSSTPVSGSRHLTAADLCDHCSAPGKVETVIQGGSLLWCTHHFAFFEDALDAFGATILVDERLRQPIAELSNPGCVTQTRTHSPEGCTNGEGENNEEAVLGCRWS